MVAGMSSGLWLVTNPLSTTTSSSTQMPPAFSTSVLIARSPRGERAVLEQARFDQNPGAVADRADGLAGFAKGAHECDGGGQGAQLVGIHETPGQDEGVELSLVGAASGRMSTSNWSPLSA